MNDCDDLPQASLTWKQRLRQGQFQSTEIFKSVWIYVVVGIAIGAVIHEYVPTAFIARLAGAENPFAVPLAVAIGVPLYANVAGVLPITEALVNKGMPLGTVLAFTMAVTALSLPEMVILRKVLRPRLLSVFIAVFILMEYRGAGGSAPCVGVEPTHPALHTSGNRYITWIVRARIL